MRKNYNNYVKSCAINLYKLRGKVSEVTKTFGISKSIFYIWIKKELIGKLYDKK